MTIRARVLNLDGVPDRHGDAIRRAILPGAVPVSLGFDASRPPVGIAMLIMGDGGVDAEIRLKDPSLASGRYPCVEGLAIESKGDSVVAMKITGLSLCVDENADPRIQPISVAQCRWCEHPEHDGSRCEAQTKRIIGCGCLGTGEVLC